MHRVTFSDSVAGTTFILAMVFAMGCADGPVVGDEPETTSSTTTTTEVCTDCDEDGVSADEDCDDHDPLVFPGAVELCNHIDDDCDGFPDNGFWTPAEQEAGLVLRCMDLAEPFQALDRVLTSAESRVADPEFEASTLQFTWLETGGNVWVGDLDPTTGAMIPEDGKGTLITQSSAPMSLAHNGPEWMLAANGPHVLFSVEHGAHTQPAHAYQTANGEWEFDRFDMGSDGIMATGSLNLNDTEPLFTYWNRTTDNVHWSYVDLHDRGVLGPFESRAAPRFVQGTHFVVWNRVVDGVPQSFLFDLDNDTAALQITQGPASHIEPFMWPAPERSDELWFVVSGTGDGSDPIYLEVYGPVDDGWEPRVRIYPPAAYPYVVSPEAMVTSDGSYITFVASDGPHQSDNGESQIWLLGALPENDLARKISGDEAMIRKDPESLVTATAAWVYYTEREASNHAPIIHWCETGLGSN